MPVEQLIGIVAFVSLSLQLGPFGEFFIAK
jgi:hypothetical protein